MPISVAQKLDLEQTITFAIEGMCSTETAKQRLIRYLLSPTTGDNLKKLSTNLEAKEAFNSILEERYLVAATWLENKIFLGKADANQTGSTAAELASVIFNKLRLMLPVNEQSQFAEDVDFRGSFIYQAFVENISPQALEPDNMGHDSASDSDSEQPQTSENDDQVTQKLLDAAYTGINLPLLKEAIVDGLDLNKKYPPYGGTLLSYAVVGGQTQVVDSLLRAGADPNITDNNQNLPLQWAVLKFTSQSGSNSINTSQRRFSSLPKVDVYPQEIIGYLLDAGSRVDIKDKQDQSPWDLLQIAIPEDSENSELKKIRDSFKKRFELSQDDLKSQLHELLRSQSSSWREILSLVRQSTNPTQLLKTRFALPNQKLLTPLEFAIAGQDEPLFVRLLNVCPLSQLNDDQGASLLTFALNKAFQARYVDSTVYLSCAEYLLKKGARATKRDIEIIESFYPNVPEAILRLTHFPTESKGLNAKVSRYDAEQAQKAIFKKTGIQFEIEFVNDDFVLRHKENFCQMEVDGRKETIKAAFGDHALGIVEVAKPMNMGWSQVTLTVPTHVIPQIVQDDFSTLKRELAQLRNIRKEIQTKREKEREKNLKLRETEMKLNLSRTESKALEVHKWLEEVMPNQWELVPTQAGYELQYPIGFRQEKEKFDASGFLGTLNRLFGVELDQVSVSTPRGSMLHHLVISSANMEMIQKGEFQTKLSSITTSLFYSESSDEPPNLHHVLKLIELKPILTNDSICWFEEGQAKYIRPLHFAISEADLDAVKKLIDLGADLNALDSGGVTPLQLALEKLRNVPQGLPKECLKQIVLLLAKSGAEVKQSVFSELDLIPDEVARLELRSQMMEQQKWFRKNPQPKRVVNVNTNFDGNDSDDNDGDNAAHVQPHRPDKENFDQRINKWALPQNMSNLEIDLRQLKQVFKDEIQHLILQNSDEPKEKPADLAKMMVAIETFIHTLNADEAQDGEKEQQLKSIAQEFRDEAFTTGEKVWILIASFIDTVIGAFSTAPETESHSSFKFFKPFREDRIRQEVLEFSKKLDQGVSVAPLVI